MNLPICMGNGNVDAVGMIIIPAPRFTKHPAPYDYDAPETQLLKQITRAADINIDNWFITPAVVCKSAEVHIDHFTSCRGRLKELLAALSPGIVVLCGKVSLQAFTGLETAPRGALGDLCSNTYRPFYTYDFTDYLEGKDEERPGWQQVAKEMMEHWTEIGQITKTLISERNAVG